jgi:hypothetical protein
MAGGRAASSHIVTRYGQAQKKGGRSPPVSLPVQVALKIAEGVEEISERPADRHLLPLLIGAVVPQRLECLDRHLSRGQDDGQPLDLGGEIIHLSMCNGIAAGLPAT